MIFLLVFYGKKKSPESLIYYVVLRNVTMVLNFYQALPLDYFPEFSCYHADAGQVVLLSQQYVSDQTCVP